MNPALKLDAGCNHSILSLRSLCPRHKASQLFYHLLMIKDLLSLPPKHTIMNASFVTLVYTEHISSLNIIIILGTALGSMIEGLSFMRICDMPKFSRGGQTSGIGICLFATQIPSVHSSLSDLLDQFVSAKCIQVRLSTF